MNYKLYFLFILLAFMPFLSEAGVLKGVVTDQKGITLPYATIFIEGLPTGLPLMAMATTKSLLVQACIR